jgi:hypothetical protein
MEKQVITRKFIIGRIDSLLQGEVTIREFGDEMIGYLAFGDKYSLEAGQKKLLEEVLNEFIDMHDVGRENVGYEPYVPSREKLIQIKEMLQRTNKE